MGSVEKLMPCLGCGKPMRRTRFDMYGLCEVVGYRCKHCGFIYMTKDEQTKVEAALKQQEP